MLYCHESDCLLFLASPLVDGLEALTSRGLFISDIPIHDATRDVILVGEQARAQVSRDYLAHPRNVLDVIQLSLAADLLVRCRRSSYLYNSHSSRNH